MMCHYFTTCQCEQKSRCCEGYQGAHCHTPYHSECQNTTAATELSQEVTRGQVRSRPGIRGTTGRNQRNPREKEFQDLTREWRENKHHTVTEQFTANMRQDMNKQMQKMLHINNCTPINRRIIIEDPTSLLIFD